MPPIGDPALDPASILLMATDSVFIAMDTVAQMRAQVEDIEILINNTLDLIDQAIFQIHDQEEPEVPMFEKRKRFGRKMKGATLL